MTDPRHNQRDVYPPTGSQLSAKSWLTEAPMEMGFVTVLIIPWAIGDWPSLI